MDSIILQSQNVFWLPTMHEFDLYAWVSVFNKLGKFISYKLQGNEQSHHAKKVATCRFQQRVLKEKDYKDHLDTVGQKRQKGSGFCNEYM